MEGYQQEQNSATSAPFHVIRALKVMRTFNSPDGIVRESYNSSDRGLADRRFPAMLIEIDWHVEKAKHHAQAVRLERNLFQAGLPLEIVKGDVGWLVRRVAVPDPRNILLEFGRAHSSESDPQPPFIQNQHTSAPTYDLSRRITHRVQVNHSFHLQSFPVGDHNVAIHSGEINEVPAHVAIVGPLHRNINPLAGPGQAYRIPLFQACDPDVLAELKNVVGVRAMRFGSQHAAIVNVSRKSLPGIFAKSTPFPHYPPFGREFNNHIEPCYSNQ